MNIELFYGMGWGGTEYYMRVDGVGFELSEGPDGQYGLDTEEEAKLQAVAILYQEFNYSDPIDDLVFQWDGSM
jgi:hypothetical protein